jgi:hypothetical protein
MSTRSERAGGYVAGLECLVGDGRVVIPMSVVEQVIEYDVSPLPLARKGVRGLGMHAGALVVSIGVDGTIAVGATGHRKTKGVLLRALPSPVRWAVEVIDAVAFVELDEARASRSSDPASPWLRTAKSREGREVSWLDASRFVSELSERLT